jgi:hypothetical protein
LISSNILEFQLKFNKNFLLFSLKYQVVLSTDGSGKGASLVAAVAAKEKV